MNDQYFSQTFRKKCLPFKATRYHTQYLLSNDRYTRIFHVIAFDFEKFLQCLKRGRAQHVLDVTDLCRQTHVHLLVHSLSFLEGAEPVRTRDDYVRIRYKFFNTCPERRNLLCNASSGLLSLKEASGRSVLRHLRHLRDARQLNLPAVCVSQLYLQSPSYFQLPPYSSSTALEKRNDSFLVERFWPKEDTVRLQHDFYSEMLCVVISIEIWKGDKKLPFCMQCVPFFANTFNRHFYWNRETHPSVWVQDPLNWCHACKQMPLFCLMSEDQFQKTYPNLPPRGNRIKKVSYSYRKSLPKAASSRRFEVCTDVSPSWKLLTQPLSPPIPNCSCIVHCAVRRWPFRTRRVLENLIRQAYDLPHYFIAQNLDRNEYCAYDTTVARLFQLIPIYTTTTEARSAEQLRGLLLKVVGKHPREIPDTVLECLAVIGKSNIVPHVPVEKVTEWLMEILKDRIPRIEKANSLFFPLGLTGTVYYDGEFLSSQIEYF